ncbi:uncharacterized protein LOC110036980 [Phalaenopsis equestris]|uniref:uncharacterized protein LOC110036980 n=1 Tax=Phalaenopsis equestris TaxID=78828 RepID=UPI0009E45B82|nr:uncharacterized protein LOC110036980 [Phalaenopsis equestris]
MGSDMDLQLANENLLELINMQEALYAQKANKTRFCEGDRNSKYYHACINYRRKSNTIHKILSQEEHWITNAEGIANDAVHYFQKLFRSNSTVNSTINATLFDKEREFNNSLSLTNIPDEKEIWEALKSIDSIKVAGPDGFSADFYKKEIWEALKSIDSTKVAGADGFSADFYKKAWHVVKGEVLISRGFSSSFVSLISRWLSNNFHSILINGSTHGFFSASRGIKQGDPLSPTIFILAFDYLSRILNELASRKPHSLYSHKSSLLINHLAFADDIIIFTKASKCAVKLLLQNLETFQDVSGMKFNKQKYLSIYSKQCINEFKSWVVDFTGLKNVVSKIVTFL